MVKAKVNKARSPFMQTKVEGTTLPTSMASVLGKNPLTPVDTTDTE